MYCPAISRGRGAALFSNSSLLPVIKSPSENGKALTMRKHEETQISSIKADDNILYPYERVCRAGAPCSPPFSRQEAIFQPVFTSPGADLRRVTCFPQRPDVWGARCLWKNQDVSSVLPERDPIEAAAHYFRGHAPLWTRIYSYSKSLGYFWMQLSWSWKELLKCTYSNRKVTFKEEIYHLCLKSVLHCGFSRVRLPPPSKHLHVSVNVLK